MKLEIDWLEMAKAVVKAIWPFVAGAFGGLFSGCTFGENRTHLRLTMSGRSCGLVRSCFCTSPQVRPD